MATFTLSTSPKEVSRNTSITVGGRLLAWYSNPTSTGATINLKLQAISQGTTYTGTNKTYRIVLDNTDTGTVTWADQPLNQDTWVDVATITQFVTFDKAVTVWANVWTYVFGTAWIPEADVRVNAIYTAPTLPTISASGETSDSLTATYGTVSFGVPATGTVTLFGGTTANPTDVWATSQTTGNNTYTQSGLVPNTVYYLRTRAYNNQLYSNFASTTATTLPPSFDIEMTEVGEDSATFSYSKPADGGALTETLYYSLDNGSTWTSFAATSTGEELTGTVALSGLTAETSYTLKTKLTTTSGDYNGTDVTFTTGVACKLYGSVNNVTERVEKLYGPKPVLYYSVATIANQTYFNPSTFQSKYNSVYGSMTVEPVSLLVNKSGGYSYVTILFSNGSSTVIFNYPTNYYNNAGVAWGWQNGYFPPVDGSIVSSTFVGKYVSKLIDKLYGSVNGVTKRIF